MEPKKLVLIFGATGQTGYHIVNRLLEHGYAIRIVARNKNKVSELFKGKQASFQKIVLGTLKDEKTLKQSFEPSQTYGEVIYVVSALGSIIGGKQSAEELQYLSQVRIIEKCQQVGIKKYVLISALLVGRPWHPVSAVLNTIIPDLYVEKAKAQNYLRRSGLNYAIVRPSVLSGDEKNTNVTSYKTSQKKQFNGSITRCTVAKIIQDVLQSESIPPKVTFDCTGTTQKNQSPFNNLKEDTEFSIQKSNHRNPKYVYGAVLLSLLSFGISLLARKYIGNQSA